MNPIAIIGLIISIIRMLPKLFSVGSEIIKLLPKFKEGGLINDLGVVWEIIKLIVVLASDGDRALATANMIELRNRMRASDIDGLKKQRDGLRLRRRMSKVPQEADVVEKV